MDTEHRKEIDGLQRMTVNQLRARYAGSVW